MLAPRLSSLIACFNTQPPEGGWVFTQVHGNQICAFQHTAARRRLDDDVSLLNRLVSVSTHSRPKAAGHEREDRLGRHRRFNTQPPEGGWKNNRKKKNRRKTFQHTAARRRLASMLYSAIESFTFQHTAARRRLAGLPIRISRLSPCFNTQPPEGGWTLTSSVCGMQQLFQHTAARRRLDVNIIRMWDAAIVSTHSRPKAAG